MDVALAIEQLVPAAKYGGSTTDNTRECYEALRWEDRRAKPTWAALEAVWAKYTPPAPSPDLREEIDRVKERIAALEAKDGLSIRQ